MDETVISETDRLTWFKGDQQALDLYQAVVAIADIWDNLIDKDKPVGPDDVNRLMELALVGLPLNPFFQKHATTLYPALVASVVSYIASTKLETLGTERDLEVAHVLRYGVFTLPAMALVLSGGMSHAVDVLVKAGHVMIPEGKESFIKEHQDAKSAQIRAVAA